MLDDMSRGDCGHEIDGLLYIGVLSSEPYEKVEGSRNGFCHLRLPVGGKAYGTREKR